MTIIATCPVPATARLDAATTLLLPAPHIPAQRRPLPAQPSVHARAAAALFEAGLTQAETAAVLGVTEAEAIELWVDHACAVHGAPQLVGIRTGLDLS